MAVGGLIHSEVEGDLRRKGYQDHELDRTMDMILLVDRLYQEFIEKRSDSGGKGRVGQPDGTEAAQTMIAERQKVLAGQPQEGERKSRAV